MGVAQSVPEFEPLTITGVLDENSEVFINGGWINLHIHTFEGVAGQRVIIDLISDEFDAYLILLSPDKALLEQNDWGDGTNARMALELPITGTYSIGVNSWAVGETGRYQLTVRAGTAADVEWTEQLANATHLMNQGLELSHARRYEDAEPLLQEALSIQREQLGDRHPDVATSLNNLAEL
jgi:hypothetical protein